MIPSLARATLFAGLATVAVSAFAATEKAPLPADLAPALAKARPGSTVVAAKQCALGSGTVDAVGMLLRTGAGPASLGLHLATKSADGWKIVPVSSSVSYARGGDGDILADWRSAQGADYEILCTTLPNKDAEILPKGNGLFIAPFSKRTPKEWRHLCFPASQVYNNWSCISAPEDGQPPRSSFVQLYAD